MAKMACETVLKEGMFFESSIRGHKVLLDAKAEHGGKDQGPSPKELLLSSITGCSGMDVASLLRKFRLPVTDFRMKADADLTEGHPSVFDHVNVEYSVQGEGVDPQLVIKAVTLSMTKYCGVSAMIAEICPIHIKVFLNGQQIHTMDAQFQIPGF